MVRKFIWEYYKSIGKCFPLHYYLFITSHVVLKQASSRYYSKSTFQIHLQQPAQEAWWINQNWKDLSKRHSKHRFQSFLSFRTAVKDTLEKGNLSKQSPTKPISSNKHIIISIFQTDHSSCNHIKQTIFFIFKAKRQPKPSSSRGHITLAA